MEIIAYKQPITRVEIEEIRGVNCEMMLKKLVARGLIEAKDRLDAIGKPLLYRVTDEFLDAFQLEDLKELPLFLTNREIVQSEISNWLKGDVSLHSMFSYNFASEILPFIQDDQGAAITVEGAYQVLNQKNICFIPFYPELSTNTVFIWKKYTRFSPVIDRFIKKVQEYLEKSRSLYEK